MGAPRFFSRGNDKNFEIQSLPRNYFPFLTIYFTIRFIRLNYRSFMKKISLLIILLFQCFTAWSINPLPANQIFQLAVKPQDPNAFQLIWQIKPGYFLYQKRIHLSTESEVHFSLGDLVFPKPIEKKDRFGHIEPIYRTELVLPVSILGKQPGENLLKVHYQGCSDDGFCYPPQTQSVKLTINPQLAVTDVTLEESAIPPAVTAANSDQNKVTTLLASNNWALIVLGFLGFGLLLSFTPCVLPMVPVLSGIIVGHGHAISTRKAFLLSVSYVLSMSLSYALVGAIVALMGNNLQTSMQSPWVISGFSLIFVMLSLSMFNLYDLKLPLSWQNKLANVTRTHEGGHYLNAALMGALSTLILSPCVTAPLIGVLGYIAQTGNVLFGSMALFFLGLGMGIPLLLIGLSAGKLLPKAGHWMNGVKALFGIIMLGMAIYLLSRILPAVVIMGLWGSLLIFSGIFAGAFTRTQSKAAQFGQGLGLMALTYGILMLIGMSMGHTNPLFPLADTATSASISPREHITTTLPELQRAIHSARGKPIVLDFYADWCTSCKVIAATTLQDPAVLKTLDQFQIIKVDLTKNNGDSQAILNYFHVVAPPTFLFYSKHGREILDTRLVGEISTPTFLKQLDNVLISNGQTTTHAVKLGIDHR